MAFRRKRFGRSRGRSRGSGNLARTVRRVKKSFKQARSNRAIKASVRKTQGKLPFTFKFHKSSRHHPHHHQHHGSDGKKYSILNNMTILISRSEFKWCSRMAKLYIMSRQGNRKLDKIEYREIYLGCISSFIAEGKYEHYLVANNAEKFKEAGIALGKHHKSATGGFIKNEEHKLDKELANDLDSMFTAETAALV